MTRIMPENLQIGYFFRLTGTANDPAEAADSSIYEVLDLDMKWVEMADRKILIGCTVLTRRNPEETPFPMGIGPWVPLFQVGTTP